MAEINGGELSFSADLDNDKLDRAIAETLRRVQGLSKAVVGSGDAMDSTTVEIVECIDIQKRAIKELEETVVQLDSRIDSIEPGDAQNKIVEQANAARIELDGERQALIDLEMELESLQRSGENFSISMDDVRKVLGDIGVACEMHEKALQELESEYQRLGKAANDAFMAGRDDEFRALKNQQNALQGEMRVRKSLLKELREQSNALDSHTQKLEDNKKKVEENAQAHVSFRTQLRNVREELLKMELAGKKDTDTYRTLEQEAGRLAGALSNVNKQTQVLGHNQSGFQGVISGLTGLSGGFSAATGAISLFAGQNDDLQKIMVKVQSLMAITIGLQQVQQALHEKSAFQLVTINGLKEWWNGLVAKATIVETAETAATVANTTAQNANTGALGANTAATAGNTVATGAQATAAGAGTVANIGLAGAFRLVGLAIKSIPVFGWILAGISALIGLYSVFSKKTREAKKAQEEFNKSLIEGAYKPIAAIENLSLKWNQLGDDLNAKTKFIEANRKAFDELGASINDVADAERLLNAGKKDFIDAQIAKASAAVYTQQANELANELTAAKLKLEEANKTKTVTKNVKTGFSGEKPTYEQRTEANPEIKKWEDKIAEVRGKMKSGYEKAAAEESEYLSKMKELGIKAANGYADGTVGAIEQAISKIQEKIKNLSIRADIEKEEKEIEKLQKQRDNLLGNKKDSSSKDKDPFLEKLQKQKAEYQRFLKWINSGDETIAKTANKEFEGLLKQGATYIDYLKKQRDQIESIDIAKRTKEQNDKLSTLNNQLAEEAKKTVLESFNTELSEQLNNAQSIIEVLNIIEQRRLELANDGTELDNTKREKLDDAEKNALKKQKEETDALLDEYSSYLDKKIKMEEQFTNDMILLEKRRKEAKTDAEREEVERAMAVRTEKHENDSKGSGDADYDAMLQDYAGFEQKKQSIIDDFDEKRKKAMEHGNEDLINSLNEAQAKALSSLASDELMGTEMWANLFGNLDEFTAEQITTLVNEIERQFDSLSGIFNPIDLANVRNKLNEAKAVVMQDNPFKQLGANIREIFNNAGDDSKDSASKIKKNWKNLSESTKSSFDFVQDAIASADFLKEAIGEVGATAISSLSTVAATSIAVAAAINTAENASVVLVIIKAALVVVQAIINVVKSVFAKQDKQIEGQIKRHAQSVKQLQEAYDGLERSIDKALGSDKYKQQEKLIKNLEEQKKKYKEMAEAEGSKKKSDQAKIDEFNQAQKDATRKQQDIIDSLKKDLLQGDAKEFAQDLGDALISAFKKGENAADAWGKKVDEIVGNIVKKLIIQNMLEKPIGGIIKGYTDKWISKDGKLLVGTDQILREVGKLGDDLKNEGGKLIPAVKEILDSLKVTMGDIDANSSLTGAVKGVTEETASMVAGQMNAIRINQMEATAILRQQLVLLSAIARNTAYNRFIEGIYNHLRQNSTPGDPLRSQGLQNR